MEVTTSEISGGGARRTGRTRRCGRRRRRRYSLGAPRSLRTAAAGELRRSENESPGRYRPMCVTDDCPEGMDRRAFLAGTTAAAVSLAAAGTEVAGEPPAETPPTRVLGHTKVLRGKVTFKYNGKDTF